MHVSLMIKTQICPQCILGVFPLVPRAVNSQSDHPRLMITSGLIRANVSSVHPVYKLFI